MKILVTGATGFVGGHVAEELTKRGHQVVTIARSSSDTAFLNKLGVAIVPGDLTEVTAQEQAIAGVDAVIHCAAKVGEWGAIEPYRKVNVEATESLIRLASKQGVKRFVFVSSLGVYPARDHFGTDESEPIPTDHIDAYTQTKGEADRLAIKLADELKLPLVIIRPGFVYGPRDRTVMPRILTNLKRGVVSYMGSADKKINNSYVGNVVQGIMLGLESPAAVGKIFNIRDGELVSKREFFETISTLSGLPKPSRTVPMWLAKTACNVGTAAGKLLGFEPMLTPARLKFLGLNLDYSIDRAKRELNYQPETDFQTGMRKTIDWLRQENKIPS